MSTTQTLTVAGVARLAADLVDKAAEAGLPLPHDIDAQTREAVLIFSDFAAVESWAEWLGGPAGRRSVGEADFIDTRTEVEGVPVRVTSNRPAGKAGRP